MRFGDYAGSPFNGEPYLRRFEERFLLRGSVGTHPQTGEASQQMAKEDWQNDQTETFHCDREALRYIHYRWWRWRGGWLSASTKDVAVIELRRGLE